MRGRLMGVQMAVVAGGPRLGDLEAGAVATAFGEVRVKDVRLDGTRRAMPEYDDVARIARERNEPIHTIYRAVESALEDR